MLRIEKSTQRENKGAEKMWDCWRKKETAAVREMMGGCGTVCSCMPLWIVAYLIVVAVLLCLIFTLTCCGGGPRGQGHTHISPLLKHTRQSFQGVFNKDTAFFFSNILLPPLRIKWQNSWGGLKVSLWDLLMWHWFRCERASLATYFNVMHVILFLAAGIAS